ncbi:MAG: helix-turn-helix domain-containing protein [Propionibacteriales bacterium]|jgi:excisionase family DNA binding protein|nr:helix-turn-helix domain-containing protein [Propionibacteriales bacterium]
MSTALTEDVKLLRSGLASEQSEIEVTLRLPRESAKKVLALLDAEQSVGAVVIPAKQEFTTSEAAAILDMSRPSLMKLVNAGRIEFRKVGKHHRIPAAAIQTFRARQREEGRAAVTAIAELSNRVGQLD